MKITYRYASIQQQDIINYKFKNYVLENYIQPVKLLLNHNFFIKIYFYI